jgi:hypothetical protein
MDGTTVFWIGLPVFILSAVVGITRVVMLTREDTRLDLSDTVLLYAALGALAGLILALVGVYLMAPTVPLF